MKACEKVKAFIIGKIELLTKPKTNIHILQKNILLKYNIFLQFLKEHYIDDFIQICNCYLELMSKIYYNNFKHYLSELLKLSVDLYNKNDTLINDNIQYMRLTLPFKISNMTMDNRSIFSMMGRDSILTNLEEDPIILPVAIQKNLKVSMEAIFKSINKLVLDTVIAEFQFTSDFFTVSNDQNKVVFGNIFKSTINYILEQFKYLFSNSYDCTGILLISLINNQNKTFFNSKGILILDAYFDQISQAIWPRFKEIFDYHTNTIRLLTIKMFKTNERNMGSKIILLRYIDFALCLCKIASIHSDNNMLRIRITELKNLMVELLKKSSKELLNETDRIIYLISSLDFILSNLIANNYVFQEDIMNLEKELSIHIDKMVEIGLKEYFEHMMNFVKQYVKDDEESINNQIGGNGGIIINSSNGNTPYIANKSENVVEKNVNYKLIENISAEFGESWIKRVDAFKDLCYKNFNNSSAYKKIIKKFLQNLLSSYGKFNKYVRENYSSFASSIPQLHQFMKEIQNQEKRLA